mmetsp:Transcript_15449/g.22824  ORF Transcript_15449/g.22824 Transcript_15449/m.22824 type:complete len:91 (+) Transcript_15449:13-285(+)
MAFSRLCLKGKGTRILVVFIIPVLNTIQLKPVTKSHFSNKKNSTKEDEIAPIHYSLHDGFFHSPSASEFVCICSINFRESFYHQSRKHSI